MLKVINSLMPNRMGVGISKGGCSPVIKENCCCAATVRLVFLIYL